MLSAFYPTGMQYEDVRPWTWGEMPTCADVKNVYGYTSASLYIFTARRAQGTVLWRQL